MIDMVDKTLKSFPLSGDFADVIVRKAASQDDLDGAAAVMGYSSRKRPDDFRSPQNADKAGLYVVGEPGNVEGAGYFTETKLCIGSTVARGVRPEEMGAESQGVPDPRFVASFRACFKLAREQGIHVAAVHGSQWDHAMCGFVPCFYYPVASLSCEQAQSIVTRATLVEAAEAEEEQAKNAWLRDPHAPKMSAYIGGGKAHVIRQDDQVVGYVRLNSGFVPSKKCGMPFGFVTDVTTQSREAALAVIRAGASLAGQAGETALTVMQSHETHITQAMLGLGGTYLLRGACDLAGLDAEMVAIVDLPGLTTEMGDDLVSRVAAAALGDAALSIEVEGQVAGFVVEDRELTITAEKQPVHRRLPRWVTTRLYMGYYSGSDVLAMGPIPWDRSDAKTPDNMEFDNQLLTLPGPETALFRALFPKLWPCAWPDPDVWPWVIGQACPKYQNEERKTPDMKAAIDALRFPWQGR